VISWLDWVQAQSAAGVEQQRFVSRLLQLRREHCTLRSGYFQHGQLEPLPQVRDIEWFDENGDVMRPEDWGYTEGRLLCVRRALRLDEVKAEVSLILINSSPEARGFQLPQPQFRWCLRLDTASGALIDRDIDRAQLEVAPHTLLLLTAVVEAPSPATAVHTASDTAVQPGVTRRSEPAG
jgi:glycogen operon protein